jgi:hypothetical protein
MKLEGLFALYPPLRFDSDFHKEEFARFESYLNTSRQVRVRSTVFQEGQVVSVRAEPCRAALKRIFFKDLAIFHTGNLLLRVEGSFDFPGPEKFPVTDPSGKIIPHSEDELRSIWISMAPDFLDLTIQTYLLSLMIAFSGAVQTIANVWLIDGKRHHFSSTYRSSVHESIEFLVENGVEPRVDIVPEKAVDWTFSKNGIFDGYSDTPAARSLNYFTRLFVREFRDDELSDLVWAVAGIEALLVEGGRSSIGQLKEKLRAVFEMNSKLAWILNMTEEMYNYRSKMIHGNRQIKSEFRSDEEPSKNRFAEEYNGSRFAVGILLMLLQDLIESEATKFDFRTVRMR